MTDRQDWDRTRLDLHPTDEPGPASQPLVEEEVADSQTRRVRLVRRVCAGVNLVCGLFAVVLGLHIVLVLAEANPDNGFASLVDGWAGAVSLGLGDLFTPGNAKLQTLLNDGLAAVVWLLIAGAVNYAIRQFALPGPRRAVRYRRHVVE
jgi:hypothetical protein